MKGQQPSEAEVGPRATCTILHLPHLRAAALRSPPAEPVRPAAPRGEPPGRGACAVGRGLGPRPRASRVLAQRRVPGRARLLGDHTAAPPACLSSPLPPRPGQSRAKARGAAVSARESPGRHRGPGGGCPNAGGRRPSGPPTAAPPPGGPELADGRLGSRARAEGCGAAWSRTPAPAAEVTAPLGNGLGAPDRAAGAGWRGRGGAGKAWTPAGGTKEGI